MYKKIIWSVMTLLLGLNMVMMGAGMAQNDLSDSTIEEDIDQEEPGQENHVLYNVLFPANVKAYLDPGNLSGKGEIFSKEYAIENYGSTDITVLIKNIDICYISKDDIYEFSEEEIDDDDSRIKKLNVNMVWKNEDKNMEKLLTISEDMPEENVLFLSASEYDKNNEFIRLREGSVGSFYFTGTLNSNPNIVWEDGEIILRFEYSIVDMQNRENEEAVSDEDRQTDDNIDDKAPKENETSDVQPEEANEKEEEGEEIPENKDDTEDEKEEPDNNDQSEESSKEGLEDEEIIPPDSESDEIIEKNQEDHKEEYEEAG